MGTDDDPRKADRSKASSPLDELQQAVARETAKQAAAGVLDAAAEAASSLFGAITGAFEREADSVLSAAERNLKEKEDARAGRIERLEEAAKEVRSERLARKERALAELERLKAEHARGGRRTRVATPAAEDGEGVAESVASDDSGPAEDWVTGSGGKRTL